MLINMQALKTIALCIHHLVLTTYSKFLVFHTFLSRQTNLESTSSVSSVKQGQYEEILDGRHRENDVRNLTRFAYCYKYGGNLQER